MCVCVCVFNDDSVYMCDVRMNVCACVHLPRMGEGKEEKGGGREEEWGLVCMCVYESLLCEIKHANGGLF